MIKNTKTKVFILILLLFHVNIFCEDWEFIVLQDSPIYRISALDEPVGILFKNQKIISDGSVGYSDWGDGIGAIPYCGFKPDDEYPNIKRYHVTNAANLIPAETTDLFGDDIISDKNTMLMAYCLDILRSRNRETLFKHEPYYETHQSYWDDADMREVYWYERHYNCKWSRFFVYNIMFLFGPYQALIIHNIERTGFGYKVRCKEELNNKRPEVKIPTLPWDIIQGKEIFDLLIYMDGNYIELYIDNKENKLGTFVSVSDEFVKQFNCLIKTNTCDLTNVPWPRRADGTMDYPPPLDMSHYLPTHRTLDNLRLRGTANTASKIVTTMPRGTEVQLIETGPVTVIDNITAPWVKVMTANGYAGWCFSGYLEAVQPQPNEIIVNAPDAAYETARLEGNQNIIPGEKDFPAVFVAGIVAGIICVAVLAGIIFVAVFILTVILKKRKR